MTSPDLPAAVNLTVHQVTEPDLLRAAIASFKVAVPEWTPGEGDTETVLMEGLATIVGQAVYAVNQVAPAVLAGLLQLWGVSKAMGAQAASNIRVTMTSGAVGTKTLPDKTRFRVVAADGSTFDLLTQGAYTQNPGDNRVFVVPVLAVTPGVYANGVRANTVVALVDPISWVESALLYTATTGGTDTESDPAYYARASAFLRAQTSALVLPSHFEAFALANPIIGRAHAISMWDSVGTVGGQVGHVTVAVTTPAGVAPDTPTMTQLAADMQNRSLAGLTIHVVGPHLVPYPMTVTANGVPGFNFPTVEAAIATMLRGRLSPAAWPWGGTLYGNNLISWVSAFPGVARVVSVGGTAIDQVVTDPIQLPTLVTPPITVHVT